MGMMMPVLVLILILLLQLLMEMPLGTLLVNCMLGIKLVRLVLMGRLFQRVLLVQQQLVQQGRSCSTKGRGNPLSIYDGIAFETTTVKEG